MGNMNNGDQVYSQVNNDQVNNDQVNNDQVNNDQINNEYQDSFNLSNIPSFIYEKISCTDFQESNEGQCIVSYLESYNTYNSYSGKTTYVGLVLYGLYSRFEISKSMIKEAIDILELEHSLLAPNEKSHVPQTNPKFLRILNIRLELEALRKFS